MASWTRYWREIEGEYLGFVDNSNRDVEALRDQVLEAYYKETGFTFVRTNGAKIHEDMKKKNILFHINFAGKDVCFGGIPFIVVGTRHLSCLYGKKISIESSEIMESDLASHDGRRKRYRTRTVRCPATITIKDIILFPSKRVCMTSKSERRHTSANIRQLFFEGEFLDTLKAVLISLPESHMFHESRESNMLASGLCQNHRQIPSCLDQPEAPITSYNNDSDLQAKTSTLREMLQLVHNFSCVSTEADNDIIDNALHYLSIIQESIKRSHPDLNLLKSEPKRKMKKTNP